jgi:putative ABC transport system permease protein
MIPLSYSVRSIFRRRFTALATIFGLGLVVFVFAAVLMVAGGVKRTLQAAGSPRNAIVLRKGSAAEVVSFLSRDAARKFAADASVEQVAGQPVASPELYVIQQLDKTDGSGPANVAFRGYTQAGFELLRKDQLRLIKGRLPRAGTSEVMLGKATEGRYAGAVLGKALHKARRDWDVVGVFEAGGSSFESEIWADYEQLAQAVNRTSGYSAMIVRVAGPAALQALSNVVDAEPSFNLMVKREDVYYEESSGRLAEFITGLGTVVAFFFALGATVGAMITMFTQVATRLREIGTLRALGFPRRDVLLAFVTESLLLSLCGAVVGCALASLLGNYSFTTINFSTFTETRFQLAFSPRVGALAAGFAVAMGLVGGILPAVQAARKPIAEASKG